MKKQPRSIEYNPASEMHHYCGVRWVENASRGLRLVGWADEILSLRHKGWYTEDNGWNGEVYRGVVYQLPARKGKPCFVYGYGDPDNDDCALVCFGDVEDTKEAAARSADGFAERFADEARDYNRAWQAGRKYEDLAEEVTDARQKALTICRELRAASKVVTDTPTLCATLRETVFSLRRKINRIRRERKELLSDYGKCEGFVE